MTVKVGDLVHIRANGAFLIRPLTGILVSSRYSKWSETIPFHRILTVDGTLLEVPYARPEDWEVISESR